MDQKKNMLFVYNPKAGKGSIKTYLSDIIYYFIKSGYKIRIHATQKKGDAIEIVHSIAHHPYDLVVCSGGDGTLDEVVTGIIKSETRIPIGYLPAGSTNDFARSLNISSHMLEAAKSVVHGREFPCDVGRFNEKYFIYIAAFGLFTDVSYETPQEMKNILGHMAYILEGVKSLSSIKSFALKLENADEVYEGDFIYGMITNSLSVGGVKHITGKDVSLNDGEFEVTLVRKPKNIIELNSILAAFVSQKLDSGYIVHLKSSGLKITSSEKMKWTLDGEYGGKYKTVSISNINKAVSILCSN